METGCNSFGENEYCNYNRFVLQLDKVIYIMNFYSQTTQTWYTVDQLQKMLRTNMQGIRT